jgi:serine/threonine-protein kinase
MSDFLDRLAAALADRYTIERELGAGGMATVYLAKDLKHRRKVAIKILRPELAAILGPDRFLREIEIAAKLNHPHILPLHDSGQGSTSPHDQAQSAGGEVFLYYVMPYVAGESLRDKINREKQPALDYAHRQGVIHRDIKPENVLLHEGVAMVMDFGIALAVSHVHGERLTETGLSIGTPAYMSPEQVSGEHVLDARCDVYSLGAVLYEMLTGETPYTGATAQVLMAKQATDPVPSAQRPPYPGPSTRPCKGRWPRCRRIGGPAPGSLPVSCTRVSALETLQGEVSPVRRVDAGLEPPPSGSPPCSPLPLPPGS